MDTVETLQSRLRAGLKTAMLERRDVEVRTLRSLLAAIDDAQAVPVDDRHDKYVVRAFGSVGVEVPRLELGSDTLKVLLTHERDERMASARQMMTLGQSDRALAFRQEADIIERFLTAASTPSRGASRRI